MNAPAGSCVSLGYPKDPGSRTRLLLTPEVGIKGMGEEELKANIINFTRLPTTTCNDSKLALLKNSLFEKKKGWDESIKEAIFDCKVIIGMTKVQALLSWGQPLKRTKIWTSLGIQEKWYYKKLMYDRSCWFYYLTNTANWFSNCLNPCGFFDFSRILWQESNCGLGIIGGSQKAYVGKLFKKELTFRDGILVTIREED